MDRIFLAKLNLDNRLMLIGRSLYNIRADDRRSIALVKRNYSQPEGLMLEKVTGGIVVCRKLDGVIETKRRRTKNKQGTQDLTWKTPPT